MAIAVSYHDSFNVLQEAKLIAHSPFDHLEWYKLSSQHADKSYVVLTTRDTGEVLALPLSMHSSGRLDALTNWYMFTWRPIASTTADHADMLGAAAKSLKTRTHRVVMAPVPDEDGSATLIEQAFRAAGWLVQRTRCDSNHILRPDGRNFASYLATRPGKLRTTLSRKSRKLDIQIYSTFYEHIWDTYEKIYACSWKPAEGNRELLKRFANAEGHAGRIRLGLALHQGEPVAAQFWTVENGTAFIHKLAHTPESKPLSAGSVLTAALFEQVIDRDHVDLVDFGTGNDPYKADWMEEIRPRYRIDCYNPARVASWPHIARAAFQRLASGKSAG